VRYWSWLFACAAARPALLGIYALLAEWRALTDPASEPDAARIKMGWWQEETRRLLAGTPVHPITLYLLAQPRAAAVDLSPLVRSVDAAAMEMNGAPLEHATDLVPHAQALEGEPLAVAARLAGGPLDETALRACTQALAVAEYLSRSVTGYRREARFGRVPFAVDELMSFHIDNADLSLDQPPDHLQAYLRQLRVQADRHYQSAADSLPASQRSLQRHLLVSAALGRKHLENNAPAPALSLQDMLLAWRTARRANG
jgi:phytoene/squalene synthetase